MSGTETARRPVVQRRIDDTQTAAPKWPSTFFLPIIFFLQISITSRKKSTKSIISQKLRIAQKKSAMQKMSARSIPIYLEIRADLKKLE